MRQAWPKGTRNRSRSPRGFSEAVKQDISHRSAGMCELDFCGPADHYHHRRPRGSGGTSLAWVNQAANGFHVSSACHDRIEGRLPTWSREQSRTLGWLVSRNGSQTAEEVAVFRRGWWVLLGNDGEMRPASDEGAAS